MASTSVLTTWSGVEILNLVAVPPALQGPLFSICPPGRPSSGSRIGVTDKCAARVDTVEAAAVAEHGHKRDAGPGAQILRHVAVRINPLDRRVGELASRKFLLDVSGNGLAFLLFRKA